MKIILLLLTNFNTNYVCSSIILMFTLGLPLGSFQHPQTHCCFVTYMPLAYVFCFTKTIFPKYFLYDPPPPLTHPPPTKNIFFFVSKTHTQANKKQKKLKKKREKQMKPKKKRRKKIVLLWTVSMENVIGYNDIFCKFGVYF